MAPPSPLAVVTWLSGAAQLIVALVVGEKGASALRVAEACFDGRVGGGGCMNFVPPEWAGAVNLVAGVVFLLFAVLYGGSAIGVLARRPAALWLAAFLNLALAGAGFLITWSYAVGPGLLAGALLVAATRMTPARPPGVPVETV